MTWSFWNHPLWLKYEAAYDWTGKRRPHGGENLVHVLREPPEMLRRLSKGHRADVDYGSHQYDLNTDDREYVRLHQTAYPGARPLETYLLQQQMIDLGIADVLNATTDHTVATALFFVWDGGSYYASGARCSDDSHAHRGALHFLMWRAMLHLYWGGIRWLDLGPLPNRDSGAKELSVFRFKKGFCANS